ncbi:MAG TPA: precorrin-8X methylmutase, partial [Candidatus Nitrosotenuis sp.]|nr:precorrin-8X methylmutase [Candidatus Nitrosotenuis sp.]
MQTRKGQSIEDESMEIIEREIGSHPYKEHEWKIVRRVIHSTADFDFAGKNGLVFHKNAIQS